MHTCHASYIQVADLKKVILLIEIYNQTFFIYHQTRSCLIAIPAVHLSQELMAWYVDNHALTWVSCAKRLMI